MAAPPTATPDPDPSSEGDTEAESEDRSARQRILASAERLFAERGFDRTSTARIAEAANVPHGLIFYYFKTKMELLLAVTQGYGATVLAELALPAPAGVDPCADFSALWGRLLIVLGQPSTVGRILFQELSVHPEVRARSAEVHEQVVAVVSAYVAAVSGHEGRPLPEHDAAARLMAIAAAISPMLSQPAPAPLTPEIVASLMAHGVTRTST